MTDTMTFVEHDNKLLELMRADYTAKARHNNSMNTLMAVTDLRPNSEAYKFGRKVADPRPFSAALEAAKSGVVAWGYMATSLPGYLASYEETRAAAAEAAAALSAHEANYTGWSRFWLVTSSPGHVHRDMVCSTCRWTTTFALVPVLSGSDEAAAVTMFGESMCTVCFPSAPTGRNIPKAVAEKVGTPEFEAALAKWRAKATEPKPKRRPRRPLTISRVEWVRRYPESEGWTG